VPAAQDRRNANTGGCHLKKTIGRGSAVPPCPAAHDRHALAESPMASDKKIACSRREVQLGVPQESIPDATAACIEAVGEKNGKRYAKFKARVYPQQQGPNDCRAPEHARRPAFHVQLQAECGRRGPHQRQAGQVPRPQARRKDLVSTFPRIASRLPRCREIRRDSWSVLPPQVVMGSRR
jgi:hypothetical protein